MAIGEAGILLSLLITIVVTLITSYGLSILNNLATHVEQEIMNKPGNENLKEVDVACSSI
jgi:hypothetical protein